MSQKSKIDVLKQMLEDERDNVAIISTQYDMQFYDKGHQAATDRLMPMISEMLKVIEFYGKENSWDEIWVEGDGLEDDGGDCACRIDWEDVEIKKANDGTIYYASGGKTAREFLAEFNQQIKKEE